MVAVRYLLDEEGPDPPRIGPRDWLLASTFLTFAATAVFGGGALWERVNGMRTEIEQFRQQGTPQVQLMRQEIRDIEDKLNRDGLSAEAAASLNQRLSDLQNRLDGMRGDIIRLQDDQMAARHVQLPPAQGR